MKPSVSLSGVGKRENEAAESLWKCFCLETDIGVAVEFDGFGASS